MNLSSGAKKIRQLIEKAIDDHRITKSEYESIIHEALDDAHIDSQERALIRELQDMIDHKIIKLVPDDK
jgi:hypothetical protein